MIIKHEVEIIIGDTQKIRIREKLKDIKTKKNEISKTSSAVFIQNSL